MKAQVKIENRWGYRTRFRITEQNQDLSKDLKAEGQIQRWFRIQESENRIT